MLLCSISSKEGA